MKRAAADLKGRLMDLETGREILCPIWFDEQAGLFEAYQTDAFGRVKQTREGKLTYLAKGKIRFEPKRTKVTRMELSAEKCELCSRQAKWQAGDETPLPPVRQGRRIFTCAQTVDVRHYCDFHYQPPRILDAKGEVMETIEDAGGVRPQWHS
jgi:hypothetical protein